MIFLYEYGILSVTENIMRREICTLHTETTDFCCPEMRKEQWYVWKRLCIWRTVWKSSFTFCRTALYTKMPETG